MWWVDKPFIFSGYISLTNVQLKFLYTQRKYNIAIGSNILV